MAYIVFLVIVALCVKPAGTYLDRVFSSRNHLAVERWVYRLAGVDPEAEMDWKEYTVAFLLFGGAGTLVLFGILLAQRWLPWYDRVYQTTPMTVDLALNTAISFATTTTWQAYGGETTMSYFSQMAGLAAQNFLAGAAGLAAGIAFIRGLARQKTNLLGNFWVDVTRAIVRVLLPLSIVGGLLLVWQGVPMNFDRYVNAVTVEGAPQTIAQGPVAALESIKNLGTNGGGFFNVNGAHPYENPTPLANFIELLMIAVLPASLTYTFGRMIGDRRHGWLIFAVMTLLFVAGLTACAWAERSNMEGKEVRFGVPGSVLAAVVTSNGATGSYNSMHDSYTAMGGMVPLVNMLLGEIVYGGLGTGLFSMVMLVVISVFIGGLMVGQTPQYLGKQLTAREMKLIGLYMVVSAGVVLTLTAVAVATEAGKAGLVTNHGPHGLTSILFAYASSFANNGQNFAGLNANTIFYNATTAVAMLAGRFGLAALALALSGSLVTQGKRAFTSGTLPTNTVTFAALVIATSLVMAGLSYLPVLALGPLLEQLT